eukprot:Lankesteria_metandrocarpae@DN9433_c0_g1_i1.p1
MGKRIVALTKTKRKTQQWKRKRIDELQDVVSKYKNVYVLSFANQRNALVKALRDRLSGKLFYGKNKIIQAALGTTPETEAADGMAKLSKMLVGERGVLFSDANKAEVESVLSDFRPMQLARTGELATLTVELEADSDVFSKFPHSMEPELRKLGLPTELQDGVIRLCNSVTVCSANEPLKARQTQILKHLDVKMSQFTVDVVGSWHEGKAVFY